ncbi:hypothetical protein L4X63_13110 [Geomonas sp. Red32]|uniref:hypothetical protein n=1 Tax=Geomonas sp. Red32 TaxID=2912856 RepID=UPI00202CD3F5|nr:hypothetical protein [Geomonas sp. Red32]MCM0082532.1 hypothetical protein [Geomonas sp. Red32]
MRRLIAICLVALLIPVAAFADEKSKAQKELETAKVAIDAFANKSGDSKLVTADVEAARAMLKKGEDAFKEGKPMFGDLKPEAGRDVKHFAAMVELYLTMGQTRLDKEKDAEELKVMTAQITKLKARVKVFEDRNAELEKLRSDAILWDTAIKDMESVKSENAKLKEKNNKLILERKNMTAEIEKLKAEVEQYKPAAPVAAPSPAPAPAVPPADAPVEPPK